MRTGSTGDPLSNVTVSLVRRGFLGVPIFFAISAFIVGLPFARYWLEGAKRVKISQFYTRRLTRLEPPYFFNLFLLWGIGAVLGYWTLQEKIPSLLGSLTYQHNLWFGHFSTVNSVVWSLEIEFQFYFLAPLLTYVFAIRSPLWRRTTIAAVALAVVLLRDPQNRRVELSLLGQIEYFAVGFLLLDIYLARWKTAPPARRIWDWIGLVSWVGFFAFSRISEPQTRQSLLFALLLLAMVGSLGGVFLPRVLGNRWVCTFGGMCYSFYLCHQWLLVWMTPVLGTWSQSLGAFWKQFLAQTLIQLPVVTIITALLFVGVEKPFMRRDWPQRLVAWWRGLRSS